MRHPARTTARASRSHHHRADHVPQHPPPGPAPRPQLTAAPRTRQRPSGQPVLDPSNVHPYREHSASARDTALPDALGQKRYREGLHMPSSARCRRPPTPHRHRHAPRSVGTHNARKPPRTSASPMPLNNHSSAKDSTAPHWTHSSSLHRSRSKDASSNTRVASSVRTPARPPPKSTTTTTSTPASWPRHWPNVHPATSASASQTPAEQQHVEQERPSTSRRIGLL